MKKFILLLLIIGACPGRAQTLTQQFNEPKVGDLNLVVALDTSAFTSGMPLQQTGQNQNWDFSNLKTASDPDSIFYLSPATVSSASLCPGTTVVHDEPALEIFLKSSTTPTTQTEIMGMNLGLAFVTFTNSAIAGKFPISYNSTSTDNCAGAAQVGTLNLSCQGKISYTADGTGTLTLADGFKYDNVIRMKTVLTFTASQSIIPLASVKQTRYEFYDMSEKFPVFSIQYQSIVLGFGSPTVSAFVSGNQQSFTGVSENDLRSFVKLFPNPTAGTLKIESRAEQGLSRVTVFDLTGSQVIDRKLENVADAEIDLQSLAPGIYLLRYSNAAGHGMSRILKE